ncbi:ABC transporter permease [Mangrovicoccus ximenensis]|uniref:ABC transporter permease n=1 Tax=Mangrovicoccus ximenensis TaxID=1911570 RepID=UPI000D3B0DE0|nr:ABC transporter permease [Mangrovicoccus ximenensis]
MLNYVAGRLAAIAALAFGISGLVFLMLRLIPGDPVMALLGTQAANPEVVERLRRQLGLDEPMATQYLTWLGNLLRGDFGYSYGQQRPVAELIAANFPATLQLTVCALFLSVLLGLAIGITAALKRNRAADTLGMGLALALMSIPSFWLGLLLILLFAVTWPIFDVVGGTGFKGVVLPAVTWRSARSGSTPASSAPRCFRRRRRSMSSRPAPRGWAVPPSSCAMCCAIRFCRS